VTSLLRLLPCGIRDDDAAGGLFLGFDALDDDAIMKRAELHAFLHLQNRIVIKPAQVTLRPGDQRGGRSRIRFKIGT
jgi:hypothetical protein